MSRGKYIVHFSLFINYIPIHTLYVYMHKQTNQSIKILVFTFLSESPTLFNNVFLKFTHDNLIL